MERDLDKNKREKKEIEGERGSKGSEEGRRENIEREE